MSAFAIAARQLKDSRFVVPMTLAVLLGIIIGLFAFYEDYQSSLHGYQMLPTRKSGNEVVQVIAFLPQIGQIIFFYLFGQSVQVINNRRRSNAIYFTIAFFLLLFDLGTDMYYKASGMSIDVWVIAFVESITVFTIGSEILLTASLGIFIELVPRSLTQLSDIFGEILPDPEGDIPVQRRDIK